MEQWICPECGTPARHGMFALPRPNWLRVKVVPRGESFEVVLSLDGYYTHESDAQASAQLIAENLGLPLEGLDGRALPYT